MKKLFSYLLATVLAMCGFTIAQIFPPQTMNVAQALSSGVSLHPHFDADYMGTWQHASGAKVFCLEMLTKNRHSGVDSDFTASETLGGYTKPSYQGGGSFHYPLLDSITTAQISWIAGAYVNTTDPLDASAAQAAVWQLSAGNNYNGGYREYLEKLVRKYDTQYTPNGSSVSQRMAEILTQARDAIAYETAQANDPGADDRIVLTQTEPYNGVAELPAGVTRASITNAVFVTTDGKELSTLEFHTPLQAAFTVNWRGLPPQNHGFSKFYPVTVNADGQKTLIATGAPLIARESIFQTTITAPKPRQIVKDYRLKAAMLNADTHWEPQISSQVPSEIVAKGENFSDTVTFSAGGGNSNWRIIYDSTGNKSYAPITAVGTLYGPFLSDPSLNPSQTVPVGAPKVGSTTITSDSQIGPGTYPVTVDWVAREAGYYSWVWEIHYADQNDEIKFPQINGNIQPSALNSDYYFTDGFGQVSERQIVPTMLTINTVVSHSEITAGEHFTDTVTVSLAQGSGGWLQNNAGERIPVTLRGRVFYSEAAPIQQPQIPSTARQVGNELTLTLLAPDAPTESDKFQIPHTLKPGYLTVVWCIFAADQPPETQGKIAESCDAYGVPTETLKLNALGEKPELPATGAIISPPITVYFAAGGLGIAAVACLLIGAIQAWRQGKNPHPISHTNVCKRGNDTNRESPINIKYRPRRCKYIPQNIKE